MMDMYVKCGLLVKSREVFCELPVKNIEAWNSLIMGYAQLGQAKKVLHIFQKNIALIIYISLTGLGIGSVRSRFI